MQAQVSHQVSAAAECYVTIEQLKDVDSRSLSRTAAVSACCEDQAAAAASAVVRAASDQAQARFESLRDRLHAEMASVQATVRCCWPVMLQFYLQRLAASEDFVKYVKTPL